MDLIHSWKFIAPLLCNPEDYDKGEIRWKEFMKKNPIPYDYGKGRLSVLRGKSSEVVVNNVKTIFTPEEKLMVKFKDDGIFTKTLLPIDKKKNISIFTIINYGDENEQEVMMKIPVAYVDMAKEPQYFEEEDEMKVRVFQQ